MSPPRAAGLSTGRKIVYSALMTLLFLGLIEIGLTVAPMLVLATRGDPVTSVAGEWLIFAGDSVTWGFGGQQDATYPRQLQANLRLHGAIEVSVANLAQPGADAGTMIENLSGAFQRLPPGSTPVVLCMLGHNDFLDWSATEARHATPTRPQGTVQVVAPDARTAGGPRLLRLFYWFRSALRADPPMLAVAGARANRLGELVASFSQASRARGGELYLLTYAVPGVARPGLVEEDMVTLVNTTRDEQRGINAALRTLAESSKVPLIDVERLVGFPDVYDASLFLDNIHLTAEGNRQVARVVRDALVLAGRLPRKVYGTELRPLL